ncbi:hypothetical protein SAMN05216364_10614 [Porphyromonadaceae bacterium KHP3R9]|nr:hypothetical protein SAMN05216364_10614 [Porphyromonadaceae bacterium KHP3R9]
MNLIKFSAYGQRQMIITKTKSRTILRIPSGQIEFNYLDY